MPREVNARVLKLPSINVDFAKAVVFFREYRRVDALPNLGSRSGLPVDSHSWIN